MSLLRSLTVGSILLGTSGLSFATPITVQSYDMNNGDTGSYNYWDDSYSGTGDNTVDRAFLSGGTGDLTDGIIATDSWNIAETPVGPNGPYVGWYTGNGNPSINFHFGQTVAIDSITLFADNPGGLGGVYAPSGVNIGSTQHQFIMSPATGPRSFTVTGLGLSVSDLSIDILGINARTGPSWVFVSEISFDGEYASVPEPASIALMGLGLIGLGFARRKKAV